MLTHLHIKNLALIPELDVELHAGLNLFTGETGAGKSIFIDALGLALGDRADAQLVRNGCERAEVSLQAAVASRPAILDWLKAHDLDTQDGECQMRRTVNAEGRSRAYINGSPVTVAQLRELGDQLVNLQGQHAHQNILRTEVQLQMLDDYAGHTALLHDTEAAFSAWHEANQALQTLIQNQNQRAEQLQLLRFQNEELTALQATTDEIANIENEHRRLARAKEIQETLRQIINRLGQENGLSLEDEVAEMQSGLEAIMEADPALKEPLQLLHEAQILLSEARHGCQQRLDQTQDDPERLSQLESRLSQLHDTARKYRVPLTELPELAERIQQEFDSLQHLDEDLESRQQIVRQHLDQFQRVAKRLSGSRRQAAEKLSKELGERIRELGMPHAEFSLEIDSDLTRISARGQDQLIWRFTANPGMPLQPLDAIASGGELSRIGLAIHSVTASGHATPCLVFDEADTGLGGKIAEFVGRSLKQLSKQHQVLCITHLPQVACFADHHFSLSKTVSKRATITTLTPLKKKADRIEELARMLGGMEVTDTARAHASEMLAAALD